MAQSIYRVPLNVAVAAVIVTIFYGPGKGEYSLTHLVPAAFERIAPPQLLKAIHGEADAIYFNASIWTADSESPWVDAIAVKGGRILKAGESVARHQH